MLLSHGRRRLFLAAALLCAGRAQAQFVNGSFETGDFTGWVTQDLDTPLMPLAVVPAGTDNGFASLSTTPTDGLLTAVTGFDGSGPGTIFLAQDVTVPTNRTTLLFDYAAGWDMSDFGAAADRPFSVIVEPEGGGSPLQTTLLQTATVGSFMDDTGLFTTGVDLSAFAGQTVRVKFAWDVPEDFTGPAICQLDNVRLAGRKLPAADVASLKVAMDFVNVSSDTLSLDLQVPVSEGFDPTGAPVNVTIGDVSLDFTLDAQGNASDGTDTLKVRPAGGNALLRKLSLSCVQGDFLADLSGWGLDNIDTGAAGLFFPVPVTVTIGTSYTARTLPVLYKATADIKGVATAHAAAEKRAEKLAVRLDFATPSDDSVTLKGIGCVAPGFTPEGADALVTIGSLTREFTLDAQGQGALGDSTLAIKRDARNPGLYAVTFKCAQADLVSTFAADGLVNATVPKPGEAVPFTVQISLDGRSTQVFMTTSWAATLGQFGTAHGAF
jgi:hypothetical protein